MEAMLAGLRRKKFMKSFLLMSAETKSPFLTQNLRSRRLFLGSSKISESLFKIPVLREVIPLGATEKNKMNIFNLKATKIKEDKIILK